MRLQSRAVKVCELDYLKVKVLILIVALPFPTLSIRIRSMGPSSRYVKQSFAYI
jgi:hypothetical protein